MLTTRAAFVGMVAMSALAPGLAVARPRPRAPRMLAHGDRVGLIAPASPPTGDDIALSLAHIESLGLVPVLGEYVRAQNGYLAGSDAQRANDFNRMARDPDIRAILAIRGGYGTMRILPMLDYAAIERDPKVLMGYSDLTALLCAVTLHSNVITFHGPLGAHGSSWSGQARTFVEQLLFSPHTPAPFPIHDARPIVPGRAFGRLLGGNLSLITATLGTPYALPPSGSLFFFEETEEAPYRIDRMLMQLDLAGYLHATRGILAGQCTKCVGDDPTPSAAEVIDDRLRAAGRPAIAGAPIGHIPTQWVLPIGALAELDVIGATLRLLEPAVSAG